MAPGPIVQEVAGSVHQVFTRWRPGRLRIPPDAAGCHGQRRPGTGKRRGRRVGDRWRGWRVDGLACWRTVALSIPAEGLPGVRESVW